MRENTEQTITKEQLSEEELQRTQVLNLADFKEVARIERITSKKPAVIVAILGFLSISVGTIFPAVQSLQARKESDDKTIVEARKETNLTAKSEKMTCTYAVYKVPDGTDQVLKYVFTFANNELIKLQKTYSMVETPGSTTGAERVKNYKTELSTLLIQKTGYQTSVKNKDKGFSIIVDVDYELLDLTKVPEENQKHYIYSIEYPAKSNKDIIKTEMENNKYICE